VRLLDEGQRDVTINGGGEDCLRAEGNCAIDLTFKSVTLTNCQRCIRAEGNSSIHLTTTTGAIQCTASADGIRAQGTADIILDAPACVIHSNGQHVRIDGHATVTGCEL
jgi:hypothetical protein